MEQHTLSTERDRERERERERGREDTEINRIQNRQGWSREGRRWGWVQESGTGRTLW